MREKLLKILRYAGITLTALVLLVGAFLSVTYLVSTPKNDRNWTLDQAVLPSAEFDGDTVTIRNIRNFSYTSTSTYTPNYYDKTFNLNELETVDFIVEPLKPVAVAHTLLSFGFTNGDYVAISVEIRKEKGEVYSPLRGLLDRFELMYVIADERDVLTLRAIHRKDELLLYPVRVSQEKARELFVSMLNRANTLREHPEFYNTLSSTCTTNIVDHVNEIAEEKVIPWDLRLIFPRSSDEYAYELGLLDTSLPFPELRKRQRVDRIIAEHESSPDFSNVIRTTLSERAR